MAITFPLIPPSTPGFRRWTFSPLSINAAVASIFTAQETIQTHAGMRWRGGFTLPPMKRPAAEAWVTFFLKLNGLQGTFLFGDPAAVNPRGSVLGTPLVNGASQTGQELITNGWTGGSNGVLLEGDYIQLETGLNARLYKILNDVDSDGGGNATIDIWPQLRQSPPENEPLVTTNPRGIFRLASNEFSWDVDTAQFYGLGFSIVEVLKT